MKLESEKAKEKFFLNINKQISDETHLYIMLTTNLLSNYSKV